MLLHVAAGTKKSLLFSRPETNANGAPRLDLQRVENPHDFHRNHGAGAIVGGACPRRPRVEMATHHDHLILHLDANRHIGFKQTIDASVILYRRHHYGQGVGVIALVGGPSQAAVVENGTAGAAAVAAVTAGKNNRQSMLRGEKLPGLIEQSRPLYIFLHPVGASLLLFQGKLGSLREILVVHACKQRLIHRVHLAHFSHQNDLPSQLAFVFVEIFLVLDINPNGLAIDCAVGGRRPGRGLGNENSRVRRRHPYPGVELLPAHAELSPVFEMGVAATHRRQLIACPLVGPAQVGRTGKARANAIHQSRGEVHYVRMEQPLVANALVHGVVEILFCRLRQFVR